MKWLLKAQDPCQLLSQRLYKIKDQEQFMVPLQHKDSLVWVLEVRLRWLIAIKSLKTILRKNKSQIKIKSRSALVVFRDPKLIQEQLFRFVLITQI